LRLKNWPCVNAGARFEAIEVNRPYLTNLTRGCLRGWSHPVRAELFRKNFDSDDHFDRSFSFMAVKGKPRNPNKRKRKEEQ
jgi:hypothetical protein